MVGIGLRAFNGKKLITYADLQAATGLAKRTLYGYVRSGRMPAPDVSGGVWDATRQDIRDWVTGTTRPGQGARTDLDANRESET